MREINTRVSRWEVQEYTDYAGSYFANMELAENGFWVSFAEHDTLVMKLQDRITYLENVCDEQVRMLTGD